MKKVLITGGAGMIGTNLVEKLLEDEDNSVIVLDNFMTSEKNNTRLFRDNPRYTLIEHDVQMPFDDLKADEIYHLAAPASPVCYQRDAIYTMKTIIIGTMNALECARKNEAKILTASTSEVYGQPLEHPQRESYFGNVHTTGIRACYDEGKRCGETLCADYARKYHLHTKIARIFNTYGPYTAADDGRVVSEFIMRTILDKPIFVNGNGMQTRSFCYVSDLVSGLIRFMASDERGPINLGNPFEINILELLECIKKIAGKEPDIKYREMPEDDPDKRCPDISKAVQLLGWRPSVSLEEGIKRTYEYFLNLLSLNLLSLNLLS